MRILHVHDIANIPPLLVREMNKRGIQSKFVEDVRTVNVSDFDIVHAHYALNMSTIRAFRAARKRKIPLILHCHGSDIRLVTSSGRTDLPFRNRKISQFMRKRAVKIFLSTPDLIDFEARGEYVPNPVDLGMFRPMPQVPKTDRTLICGKFVKGSHVLNFIEPDKQYDCVNVGDEVQFPANVRTLPFVPHEELPAFFNQYEVMIGTIHDLVSKARLEAMACGLRTFTDFEKKFIKFYDGQNPDEVEDPRAFIERFHNPDICVSRLIQVYGEVVRGR